MTALLTFSLLPAHAGSAEPKPLTGAEQIVQARRQLDALNMKVDLAVEEFDLGTIALTAAAKKAQLAQAKVTRSKARLVVLQQQSGAVAAAAYRSGGAGSMVSLVTTSSPQTFLDKASALDHMSRNNQEQLQQLRAANRELRAQSAATDQALAEQRTIAARLAKIKDSIDLDVASQQKLLKSLEVDEAKRIAAVRAAAIEAERQRQIALAAARAEKARLAKIEAARLARLLAQAQARLEQEGRQRQAARLAKIRSVRAALAAQAKQTRRDEAAAAADAAAADAQPSAPSPSADNPPADPAPQPANGGGGGGGDRASTAVRVAMDQLGKPYVWAADGPNSFDCSGLMMYAWARAGVSLPHSSRAQYEQGRHVGRSELQPGDLVFFGSPIHHVGMYIGGGSYVAAPQTGDVVSVRDMGRGDYTGAIRL